MILKKCHIENFGKLSNIDFSFDKELTVFTEDNGWGKTTFSHFLYAMLFGFEKRKRNDLERKTYLPWNEGICGGSLIIEVDDNEYEIRRTFGKSEKDDTCEIIDKLTNKVTNKFSSDIGEELFRIDRNSFAKTIYVPQCQQQTVMTDSINAKIGDLSLAKDDISEYEKVKNIFQDEMKKLKSISKKSEEKILRAELFELSNKLEYRENLYDATVSKQEHIDKIKKDLKQIEEEKQNQRELLESQSKKTEKVTLYNQGKEELEIIGNRLNKILQEYNGLIIEEVDIEQLERLETDITRLEGIIASMSVTESEKEHFDTLSKIFKQGVPNEDFINDLEYKYEELKVLERSINLNKDKIDKEKYEELKRFFEEYQPTEDEINQQISNYDRARKLETEILQDEMSLSSLSNETKTRKPIALMATTFGIALIFAIILLATNAIIPGALCLVIGIVAIIIEYFILSKSNQESNNKQFIEEQIIVKKTEKDNLEKQYKTFVEHFRVKYSENFNDVLYQIKDAYKEFSRLRNVTPEIADGDKSSEENLATIKDDISRILRKYSLDTNMTDISNVGENIKKFRRWVVEYNNLGTRISENNKKKFELANCKQSIGVFESKYGKKLTSIQMRKDYSDFSRDKKNEEEIQNKLDMWSQDIGKSEEEVLTVSEVNDIISKIDFEINTLNDEITRYERDVEKDYSELEDLEDLETVIERKQQQLNECLEKYNLLETTLNYLQIARDKYSTRYLGPLKESFTQYANKINGYEETNVDIESLDMDIDLNISVKYKSINKSGSSLSQGYRDLVDLCTRFALVDAMYKYEKPIIILDDPFVNLDKSKINNALSLVKEVAKKYQVVYFTCHESRNIK